MTDIKGTQTMSLVASNKARKPYKVEPLKVEAAKPKEDRATLMANALIDRARTEDLNAFEADPKVIEQRAWLAKNRPELSAQVDAAITEATLMEGAE
jgi:hypothetical protein